MALLVGISLLAGGGYLGWQELDSARWQSHWLSRYAADLDYAVKPGPSPRIQFPEDGPFDRRLGYVDLPRFIQQLSQRNFRIEEQARFSRALLDYTHRGFFPPYPEDSQAGLTINDCRGVPIYTNSYPRQYYERFEDIPPLVVMSLLFIEDRGLLDASRPHANPAVDWPRFTKAAISQLE
ncbi:MAG TPA: glycosyl transferase family 51, partial [Pseudomonas sp.]|nr:glycosyl transferase family 51 [Pseudomonas sp.]